MNREHGREDRMRGLKERHKEREDGTKYRERERENAARCERLVEVWSEVV